MHSLVVCLYDGNLDVPHFAVTRWKMLYHFIFVLFWIYLLSDGGRFLCIANLRGH